MVVTTLVAAAVTPLAAEFNLLVNEASATLASLARLEAMEVASAPETAVREVYAAEREEWMGAASTEREDMMEE